MDTLERRILILLARSPETCDQIESMTGEAHQSISPVLLKLERDGMICRTAERRFTRRGRGAHCYALTDAGTRTMAERKQIEDAQLRLFR